MWDDYSLERTAVYLLRVSDVGKVVAAFLYGSLIVCVEHIRDSSTITRSFILPPTPLLFDSGCVRADRVIIAESGALPARH